MTNGHLIANKLVYSHLTSIFMCIHIWHWFLSEWLYWICLYLILITKIFTWNECVHKQNKKMCSQNLHEHHTIECALCDVHLEKKKVKLSYNNISIHLGAENTEVYCLKFIKRTKTKTQIFSTNEVSFKNKGNSLVSVIKVPQLE